MNGCCFFNFGGKCITRLLVSIYTLRKVYDGNITLMLAKNDEHNEKLAKHLNKLNVDIQWFDLKRLRRGTKSAIKPKLFKESKYDNTLMLDGDLLFLKPIDDLFKHINDSGTVLTHFCGWFNNGRTMARRLDILKECFDDAQMTKVLGKHKSVNIGVMGVSKERGKKFLRKWEEITGKLAGKFIADEIAAHVYIWYDNYIADGTYNQSCKITDQDTILDNKVIHYHGNKSSNISRRSSRLWYHGLESLIRSGLVNKDYIIETIKLDGSGAASVIKKNPTILEDCYNEFKDSTWISQ